MSSEWICGRHWMLAFVWVGLSVLWSSVADAKDQVGGDDVAEPYLVYVAHESVYARCGPDGEYYRTDPLRLGQELEVYLETDDGWLGIRPPENSFSWVPAEDIELSDDEQFGRVSGPKTVAWIGTHLGRARKYRWQVQLPRGEEVAVIGKTERQDGDGTETWYRIVPPSGEFRWVHRTQIAESTEQLVQMHRHRNAPSGEPTPAASLATDSDSERNDRGADGIPAERSILARAVPASDEGEDSQPSLQKQASDPVAEIQAIDRHPIGSGLANPTDQDLAVDASGAQDDSNRSAASPRRATDVAMVVRDEVRVRAIREQTVGDHVKPPASEQHADDDSWVTGTRPSGEEHIALVEHTRPLAAQAMNQASHLRPTAPPVLRVIHHETQEELDTLARRVADADTAELQLELSRQLAAGASARMVEPIRKRSKELIALLEESVQRGHAQLVLERVERYQRVARRRDGEPEPREEPLVTPTVPIAVAQGDSAGDAPANGFVRTGYLVQVYSARPQAPPYALNDVAGRTLAYVSPALGVRLRGYLNRHVGLKGELTYDTGLNTPHVIASEAVTVQR